MNTATVNGTSQVLTYDEPVDTNSVPAASAHTVAADGSSAVLSGVAVSGSTVTLTLATAVTDVQAVTMSYAIPATNPAQDAAALTNGPVTNNSPDTTPPRLIGATVEGRTVTLTYNEALDTGSNPGRRAYSVYVDNSERGVSGSSVRGRAVTVRLSSAVTAGQRMTICYRAGRAGTPRLRDVATNITADTTGPTLSSATVNEATLTLTFDEALAAASVPASSAFTVTAAGSMVPLATSNAVSISGTAATLTLASAAEAGQTVTVSYTATASNPIRNPADHEAANLSNRAVTNAIRGLVISVNRLAVDEGGSDTYTVHLASRPASDATVRIVNSNAVVTVDTDGGMAGNQDTLTFTSSNWNMPQTVTLRVADDTDSDNDNSTMNHFSGGAYYGLENTTLQVWQRDNGNGAPVFIEGDTATRSFAENTAADQNIGAPVEATDLEHDFVLYTLDVRVRTMVAHQAEGFTERGMSVSFGWDPTPSSPLSLTAKVAPSWGGTATGGAEALWGGQMAYGMGSHRMYGPGGQLNAEVGYGLPVGARFVGTPRVGIATSEYGRDYRLGFGMTLLQSGSMNFELGFDAQRRIGTGFGGVERGVIGRLTARW